MQPWKTMFQENVCFQHIMTQIEPFGWFLNCLNVWVKDHQYMRWQLVAQGDSLQSFVLIWSSTGRNATYVSAGLKLKPWVGLGKQLNTTMSSYPLLSHCTLLLGGSELCSVAGQEHHSMLKSVSMEGNRDILSFKGSLGPLRTKIMMMIRLLLARKAWEVSHGP